MVLAVLEKAKVIDPIFSKNGSQAVGVGTVSAGWQNFFICMEMFLASVALRFAFPHSVYSTGPTSTHGRTVSLQSISSSLKETMNPRDIMQVRANIFSEFLWGFISFGYIAFVFSILGCYWI